MRLAVASNMHFKGKPETLGPLALFPLSAPAPPSLPGAAGRGVDTIRVGRVTRSPQLLLLTPTGRLPRIPTLVTSPETRSAPQLEDPTRCLGKGLVKQQLTRAHQSPSLPQHPQPLHPPVCNSHPVCQDKLQKCWEMSPESSTLPRASCVSPSYGHTFWVLSLGVPPHFWGPSQGHCSIFKGLSLKHVAAFWG